ncbi:MAG: ABC transporter permease [Oscillospiraceae bacterium]|nr:ABC transporter permease [Oscillospiraceae bacterium]
MPKKLFAYPYLIWVIAFIAIPMFFIVYYSLNTPEGLGLDNYARVFEPLFLNVFWRSIRLAVICTVICLVLGYPAGYILASKDFEQKGFIIFLFLMPMWMNFLLRTYAWMTILENNGVINSILERFGIAPLAMINTEEAVMLGMVYNFIPFMILPIYTVLKNMDTKVIEAAKDLGANPVKVFFRVIFPLSLPGVISGATMVFMPAVSTFVISDLLGGGRVFLIGNVIEREFMTASNWEFASALSVILMVTVLISIGLFSLIGRRAGN